MYAWIIGTLGVRCSEEMLHARSDHAIECRVFSLPKSNAGRRPDGAPRTSGSGSSGQRPAYVDEEDLDHFLWISAEYDGGACS